MNRALVASLACLALTGCPTTNAQCLPEGSWGISAWESDPTNPADCTPPDASVLRFDAEGEFSAAGATFTCLYTLAPLEAPMCTGAFNIGCPGSFPGTAVFALGGDVLEIEVMTTASVGFCNFTATGERLAR